MAKHRHRSSSPRRHESSAKRKSRRRSRSRSQERKYHSRRRSSSSSSSESGSPRRHDSHSRKKEKRKFRSRSRSRSPNIERTSSKKSGVESAIPGYAKMTPAERLRAKMKVLLENASDTFERTGEGVEEEAFVPPPSEETIEKFEKASFTPRQFVTTQKTNVSNKSGRRGEASSMQQHQDAIFGVWTAPKESHTHPLQRKVPVACVTSTTGQESVNLADEVKQSQDNKTQRWLNKLKQYRSTRLPPSS